MKLTTINTGMFKLDGGAMFGVVPKSIWHSLNPADENNMCTWAMRCLLVETGNRLVLIDNGIGDKQGEKFFSYYYLHGEDTLQKSLHQAGHDFNDITDVVLTHLHFDHCGGSVKYNDDRTALELAFPNATYWSSAAHWNMTKNPNAREKASFLKENIEPIETSGKLKFCNQGDTIAPGISILVSNGHTEGMIHPVIKYKEKTIVYVADMIPSSHHIPVPYVMGYDTFPLTTMIEKEKFLEEAAANNYYLYFEHDPTVEVCNLKSTPKGVRKQDSLSLRDIL